jgi:hypothetical protein
LHHEWGKDAAATLRFFELRLSRRFAMKIERMEKPREWTAPGVIEL